MMKKEGKMLLIVVNVDWLFLLHRLEIAKAASMQGWNVIVAAKDTGKGEEIIKQGFQFVNLNISRSGTSLIKEFSTISNMFSLYRKLQPDVVYQATMKPVIYGTLVSKFLRIATLNSISGLGYNFTNERKSKVQKIMIKMMCYGFNKKNNSLIFENEEDFLELKNNRVVHQKNIVNIIKGIGVDLKKFKPMKPNQSEKTRILFPTRILWDKGVREFIEAALSLKEKHKGQVIFVLCGRLDKENKEGVPLKYLKNKQIEGYIEWIGNQENMIEQYKDSDIVVLPSYREGLPVVLMEACAMGIPIVTTNAIGCKECVKDGVNGYRVPVKSVSELAIAIEKLIINPKLRLKMGECSREKAEKDFDQTQVIKKHLDLCADMLSL